MIFGTCKSGAGRLVAIAVAGLATGLITSCSENSYTAGIDGSGRKIYAHGPIEAFGSIVLNGTHYEIGDAVITVNGISATENDLAIGQIVTVQAVSDSRGGPVAESVEFEANLRGEIQAIDLSNGILFVLGQEIRVGAETAFDVAAAGDLGSLNVGDTIEVSGLVGAGAIISATHIALASPLDELRVIGRVENVNTAAFTFEIGNLVVDYASAGLIDGFAGGEPGDNDEVLAIGDGLDAAGSLIATRLVLIEDGIEARAGGEAEVEGLITRFVSVTDFDVAGKRATTTGSTVYEGGTSADLQLNVKIQIEGTIDAVGTIVAEKIEVKDGGAVQ